MIFQIILSEKKEPFFLSWSCCCIKLYSTATENYFLRYGRVIHTKFCGGVFKCFIEIITVLLSKSTVYKKEEDQSISINFSVTRKQWVYQLGAPGPCISQFIISSCYQKVQSAVEQIFDELLVFCSLCADLLGY